MKVKQGAAINCKPQWARCFAGVPARSRSNADYLTDLYDVFFRRNPDVAGFTYWHGQLNGGMTRETVRTAFLGSPEWGARINLFTNPALCP